MAVLSREEFMTRIKDMIGERTDDAAIEFVQDFAETYDNMKSPVEDWKEKYLENDREWRLKYRNAFFSGKPDPLPEDKPEQQNDADNIKIEDLFKFKEE